MHKSAFGHRLNLSSVLVALLIVLSQCIGAKAQDIPWTTDVQQAIAQAETEKKLVLLHFTADWCRPCRALDTFVFSSVDVINVANQNVVPVKVDVDQQTAIVTEYGVTSVPFDIVITPGGRIITKRKSPLDARGYQRMLASLSNPIKQLEDESNTGLQQQLNDFKDQFQVDARSLKNQATAAPAMPSHKAPVPSGHAAELARRSQAQQASRVRNPFFAPAQPAIKPTPPAVTKQPSAPKSVDNLFVASTDESEVEESSPKVGMDRGTDRGPILQQSAKPAVKAPVQKALAIAKSNNDFVATEPVDENQFLPAPKVSQPKKANADVMQMAAKPQPQPKPEAVATSKPTSKPFDFDSMFAPALAATQSQPEQKQVVAPQQTAQHLLEPVHAPAPAANDRRNNNDFLNAMANQPNAATAMLEPRRETAPQLANPVANANNGSRNAQPAYALHGKCPVTLLQQSKWVDGDPKFGCVHRDKLYIFADAAKLRLFQHDPDLYSPILAGHDPVVFHSKGELIGGKEQHGVFMGKAPNQRIVLFQNAETRAQFQQNPDKYLSTVRQAMAATGGSSSPLVR